MKSMKCFVLISSAGLGTRRLGPAPAEPTGCASTRGLADAPPVASRIRSVNQICQPRLGAKRDHCRCAASRLDLTLRRSRRGAQRAFDIHRSSGQVPGAGVSNP